MEKILELIVMKPSDKEVYFGINTNVPLTQEECNEIIKIYSRAFARKYNLEKEDIEKIENMTPNTFLEHEQYN